MWSSTWRLFLVLALAFFSSTPRAQDRNFGSPIALELLEVSGTTWIEGLEFSSAPLFAESWIDASGAATYTVTIRGTFKGPKLPGPGSSIWKLYHRDEEVKLGPGGSFMLHLPLDNFETASFLRARGPRNALQRQDFRVRYAPLSKNYDSSPLAARPGASEFWFGLDASLLKYTQSDRSDASFTLFGIASGFDTGTQYGPWHLNGDVAFGIASGLKELSARMATGRLLSAPSSNWLWRLDGGGFYTTMLVAGKSFGYQNLFGAVLATQLQKHFETGREIALTLRYEPALSTNFAVSNRRMSGEVVLGLRPNRVGERIRLSVAYETTTLLQNAVSLSARKISLGLGYAL
ncbi:MAG: hypothetical protein ABIR96_09890 [Bdellovibrionota bacterium]